MKKIYIFISLLGLLVGVFVSVLIIDVKKHDNIESRNETTNKTLCFFGDVESCYTLINNNTRVSGYENLCNRTGHFESCDKTAIFYAEGKDDIVGKNLTKAIYYLKKTCHMNRDKIDKKYKGFACTLLGSMYTQGYYTTGHFSPNPIKKSVIIDIDFKKGFHYSQKACIEGEYGACYALANNFLKEIYKPSQFSYHKYQSKYEVAKEYLKLGCSRELDKAFTIANCRALIELGISDKEKNTIYERECLYYSNRDTAKESCYSSAIAYLEGKGVRQNLTKAKEYFGKACDDGKKEACSEYAKLNSSDF